MIFASIGLLLVAGGLLAAGIAKSSTGFLALSLVCTGAAGVLLVVAYAAARGLTGLNTNRADGTGAVAAPGSNVVYVPLTAMPAGNGTAEPVPVLGYDDMSADQIVKLVSTGALSDDALEALREYEASHEGRKTVLDRVDRALR